MHTKDAEMNTSGETCIDSVPLPEPAIMTHIGTEAYTADQLRAYGDERARALRAEVVEWMNAEMQARRTAEYWKANHIAGNDRIAELEAKLAEADKAAALYRTVRRQHWFQIAAADWVGLHGAKDLSERCPKLDDRIAAIAAGGGDGSQD